MIQQSDIQGRLNLFRYGLVVIVVVTFIVALLAPFASLRNIEGVTPPPITDFLDEAIIASIVVAVLAVVIYFAYSWFLKRSVDKMKTDSVEASA